jgi:ketosteroid isomerase-like protein
MVHTYFKCTKEVDLNKDFMYAYRDGSVTVELVTQPLKLDHLAEVHAYAVKEFRSKFGLQVSPSVHCGGHQTVSFSGFFPEVVARNAIQILRYYLPALLWISCIKGTNARGAFRSLPVPGWKKNLGEEMDNGEDERQVSFNTKYAAVHVKPDLALKTSPKLIEFRYPDGIPQSNLHQLTAIMNTAIVYAAFDYAKEGVAEFSQTRFNSIKAETEHFYKNNKFAHPDVVASMAAEMIQELEPAARAIGFSIEEPVNYLIQNPPFAVDVFKDIEEIQKIS